MEDEPKLLLEAMVLAHEVCHLKQQHQAAHDKFKAAPGDAVLLAEADRTRDLLWVRQPYLLAKVCQLSKPTLEALRLITESVRV